jgi:uncharacterized protein YneF (UPF0154 family)
MLLNTVPYTYHLAVWLITLFVAVGFGFLLGVFANERRLMQPRRKAPLSRL